jgi:hypothetical protein
MIPPFSFLRPCCEKFEIVESNICVVEERIYFILKVLLRDDVDAYLPIFFTYSTVLVTEASARRKRQKTTRGGWLLTIQHCRNY